MFICDYFSLTRLCSFSSQLMFMWVLLQVQSWFQNPQTGLPAKEDSVDGSNKSNPDTLPSDKPNGSTPTSEGIFIAIVVACDKC